MNINETRQFVIELHQCVKKALKESGMSRFSVFLKCVDLVTTIGSFGDKEKECLIKFIDENIDYELNKICEEAK